MGRRTARTAAFLIGAVLCAASRAAGPAPPSPPSPPSPPASPSAASEPWLGLLLGDAVDGGVRIVAVVPDGPGDRAGIRDGDLVIRINGADVPNREALRRAVSALRSGDRLRVSILREGTPKDLTLIAGARPTTDLLGVPGLYDESEVEVPAIPEGALVPKVLEGFDLSGTKEAEARSGMTLAEIPKELRLHYGAPADAGVLVTRVDPRGPAAAAGVRVGDVLVRAGGAALDDASAFAAATLRARPDAPLAVAGIRSGKEFAARIALAAPAGAADGAALSRQRRIERLEAMIDGTRRRLEALEKELEALQEHP